MSEIRTATISDLAGTGPATLTGQYAAKAWVNFNGTGTVAIRQSGNVTSITDNGTGSYTVNFTTAIVDADYAVSGMSKKSDTSTDGFISMGGTNQTNPTTTACRIQTFGGSSAHDAAYATVTITR